MRYGTIYGLICPLAKKIVYVGQTTMPYKKKLLVAKTHTTGYYGEWIKKLTTLGLLDDLQIVPLERMVEEKNLNSREEYWIRLCNNQSPLMNKKIVPVRIKRGTTKGSVMGRYFTIDAALSNGNPTLQDLLAAVGENEPESPVSLRTLQADIEDMRHSNSLKFYAPIVYSMTARTYGYSDPSYSLIKLIQERFYKPKLSVATQ